MTRPIQSLPSEVADEIAALLMDTGLDVQARVATSSNGQPPRLRRQEPNRRGFIDLACKLGVASGITLVISSVGWGVAFNNHDRAVRAEIRERVESELRHEAELNAAESNALAEQARRQAAEQDALNARLNEWAVKQQVDEERIRERELRWQEVGKEVIENVQLAIEHGETTEATMELYFFAERIRILRPDDPELLSQFSELVEAWLRGLGKEQIEKGHVDGES